MEMRIGMSHHTAIAGIPGRHSGEAEDTGSGRRRVEAALAGCEGRIYEWDKRHGTVEVYDKTGKHRGEFDPVSGKRLAPADPRRRVEP